MGLAASQARLLTITARKADCEFQSMALSHQKIALSRDMERISDEYQAAMNKTKLVYDFYGTGTSQMTLSYGLLMTPSVYNDYFPKFLTDKENRCVLSPEYAAAAKAAGIPHEGYNGTPSSEIRNLFIESLCNNGIITPATAVSIESIPYNNEVGLGSLYSSNTATMDITYDDLLQLIAANCVDTSDYGENGAIATQAQYDQTSSYPDAALLTALDGDGNPACLNCLMIYTVDPNVLDANYENAGWRYGMTTALEGSGGGPSALTLLDLLEGDEDYIYHINSRCGPRNPIEETAFLQQTIIGNDYSYSFLNWMVDQFATVLGGVKENDLALQYAYNQIVDLIYPDERIQEVAYEQAGEIKMNGNYRQTDIQTCDRDPARNRSMQFVNKSVPALDASAVYGTGRGCSGADENTGWNDSAWAYAGEYIGMAYCGRRDMENYRHSASSIAIDLSTVAKIFLTAFVEYLQGPENSNYSYEQGQKKSEASLYNPQGDDIFTIKAPTNVNDGSEDLVASFYDSMFNIICTNGWTENENIENSEYMQEMLKTGAVYLSSIDNDAFYYQSSYSTDTYIQEVQDTDAIAQAEAKYNAQKARIENKENTIDMKMKNLDTEISSLTTEYDTMKNVITKSIEKSFKRYDA